MLQMVIILVILTSICFLLFGRRLYATLSPVKRFYSLFNSLENVKIKTIEPEFLTAVCKFELRSVAQPRTLTNVKSHVKTRPVGDIVGIVHYRDSAIHHTVKELQIYCFLLLIMAMAAILIFLGDKAKVSTNLFFLAKEYWVWSGTTPFEVLAVFELLAIIFFTAKFIFELSALSTLVNDK